LKDWSAEQILEAQFRDGKVKVGKADGR
jgi:hypothetical protein